MPRARNKSRKVSVAMPDTGTVEVDNPYCNAAAPSSVPRRIVATRSLRDDPLARLHQRRQIGEPEYRAGRAWQALYETAEVGRIASLDAGRDRVDGGRGIPDMVTEARINAIRKLSGLSRILGRDGTALVRAVLGDRRFVTEIAAAQAVETPSRGHVEYLGRRFRECLSTLAAELGYAARSSQRNPPPAARPMSAAPLHDEKTG